MKLFLDTADLDQIREACRWGIIDGATTNRASSSRRASRASGAEIAGSSLGR